MGALATGCKVVCSGVSDSVSGQRMCFPLASRGVVDGAVAIFGGMEKGV
jgi:hypothetical protein